VVDQRLQRVTEQLLGVPLRSKPDARMRKILTDAAAIGSAAVCSTYRATNATAQHGSSESP